MRARQRMRPEPPMSKATSACNTSCRFSSHLAWRTFDPAANRLSNLRPHSCGLPRAAFAEIAGASLRLKMDCTQQRGVARHIACDKAREFFRGAGDRLESETL